MIRHDDSIDMCCEIRIQPKTLTKMFLFNVFNIFTYFYIYLSIYLFICYVFLIYSFVRSFIHLLIYAPINLFVD